MSGISYLEQTISSIIRLNPIYSIIKCHWKLISFVQYLICLYKHTLNQWVKKLNLANLT